MKKIFLSLIFSFILSIGPFFLFYFKIESREESQEIFQPKIYEEFNEIVFILA
jgi:hypothetical protein